MCGPKWSKFRSFFGWKINRLQQERKILTDALKEWYDEVGQHKLLSLSMIYDQAKLLSEKMGLATIDKPRAFVDGFMRHGNIRISDTPYAKLYNEQLKIFKDELYEFCESKHGSELLNKSVVLTKAKELKIKYQQLEELNLTLSWAENFITKKGFFFRSGQDRYTQTLKTWFKRKDHKVQIAELRNKCKQLAHRCLNDNSFITDDYLTRCLAGLEAGSTDAILPTQVNFQNPENFI